jgi:hypothetical protein
VTPSLNHIDIVILVNSRRSCSSRGIRDNRCILDGLFSSALVVILATPVVLHLLIKLLLCLAGTGVRATASVLVVARTGVASASAAATVPTCVALTGDVSVDVIGGGPADVAAAAAASSATASVSTFGLALGASRALHTVEEGATSALAAAGNKREANGLALCVGTVKFADGVVCISQSLVCDEGNALGASSAVINEGKFLNGADIAEKFLLDNVC